MKKAQTKKKKVLQKRPLKKIHIICKQCKRDAVVPKGGNRSQFCSNTCRQRNFYWTFKKAHGGMRYKKWLEKSA